MWNNEKQQKIVLPYVKHIGERQEAQILKFNAPPLHT